MKSKSKKSMTEVLTAEEDELIIMFDEDGKEYQFEQVATIPTEDGKMYAILHPIDAVEGVEEDEALVFVVNDADELELETDEELAMEIFQMYYQLLDEMDGCGCGCGCEDCEEDCDCGEDDCDCGEDDCDHDHDAHGHSCDCGCGKK